MSPEPPEEHMRLSIEHRARMLADSLGKRPEIKPQAIPITLYGHQCWLIVTDDWRILEAAGIRPCEAD